MSTRWLPRRCGLKRAVYIRSPICARRRTYGLKRAVFIRSPIHARADARTALNARYSFVLRSARAQTHARQFELWHVRESQRRVSDQKKKLEKVNEMEMTAFLPFFSVGDPSGGTFYSLIRRGGDISSPFLYVTSLTLVAEALLPCLSFVPISI